MELVQDLFLTASLALILSFLVAKLVAMAVAGRESEAEFGESGNGGGEGVGVEEVSFEERRLKVEGAFSGQSQRVELVGEVQDVVQFEGKAVHRAEGIAEPLQHRREGLGLTEEVLEEKSVAVGLPDKLSVAVGLLEKSSDGGEKLSVEESSEFDRRSSENCEVEEIGAKSAGNDIVAEQSEEVRVVDCDEAKQKTHVAVSEVKSGDFSDEDDWEGIEKSELDDEYAAEVKSDGHD